MINRLSREVSVAESEKEVVSSSETEINELVFLTEELSERMNLPYNLEGAQSLDISSYVEKLKKLVFLAVIWRTIPEIKEFPD